MKVYKEMASPDCHLSPNVWNHPPAVCALPCLTSSTLEVSVPLCMSLTAQASLNAQGCCHLDVVFFKEAIMSGVYLLV